MNAPFLPVHPVHARAVAGLVDAVARWDECVSLVDKAGAGMAELLDQAERELSGRAIRCIRVCGSPSGALTLQDVMVQIVSRAGPDFPTDGDLEAGFVALTEPGEGYDRVALMVADAHGLLPSAVRYIQLACRSSPKLLVVLAGRPGLAAALADQEFEYLRRRITRRLVLPDSAADGPPEPFSAAPEPPPVPVAGRGNGVQTVARVCLAASLLVWVAYRGGLPMPFVAVLWADPSVPRGRAAVAGIEPRAPRIEATPAQPGPLAVWTTRSEHSAAPPVAVLQAGPTLLDDPAAPAPAEAGTSVVDVPFSPPEAAEAAAAPAEPPPVAAPPPEAADIPSFAELAESAAAEQDYAEAARDRAGEIALPAPEQGAASDPPPEGASSEQGAAPPVGVLDAFVPELRAQPAGPGEGDATARVDPPAWTAQERAVESAPIAEHAAARAPEPDALRVLDVAPPPPKPIVSASLPLPPGAAKAARRARGDTERTASPVAAQPVRLADERRCRVILLKVQVGEAPSESDKQFLRDGCRDR